MLVFAQTVTYLFCAATKIEEDRYTLIEQSP